MTRRLEPASPPTLTQRLDALLPQTQCTRCGYADCHAYAAAIAEQDEAINRCPPGGPAGLARLAELMDRPIVPLDPDCGTHGPLQVAVIDEHWCIGCTLCIKACPVDCIVGSHKQMHTVIASQCTGCELCLPVCPVDCIGLAPAAKPAWSDADATAARTRYHAAQQRRARAAKDHAAALEAKAQHKLEHLETLTKVDTPDELHRKRSVIEAALARARAQRSV